LKKIFSGHFKVDTSLLENFGLDMKRDFKKNKICMATKKFLKYKIPKKNFNFLFFFFFNFSFLMGKFTSILSKNLNV